MISVRNDDVLVGSSSIVDTFKRFKGVHELICKAPQALLHVPTILVEDIQKFPEAIEYVKAETAAGRMRPELHGLQHIDYGTLKLTEIVKHLDESILWFVENIEIMPTKWYTPWGANQPLLHSAAKIAGLQLIGRSMKTNGRYGIIQQLRNGHKLSDFSEIGIHWWKARDTYNLELLINYINTGILDGSV